MSDHRRRSRRSTSPKPSPTFNPSNLTEDDKLAIGKMKERNYARVPLVHPNMEDPAHYNNQQLEFIRDREYNRFRMLDFTHVTDEMILSTVLSTKYRTRAILNKIKVFPLSYRNNLEKLQQFPFLSNGDRKNKLAEEKMLLLQLSKTSQVLDSPIPVFVDSFPCFGQSVNILIANENDDDVAQSIEAGYTSLIKSAIRNKAEEINRILNRNTDLRREMDEEGFLLQDIRKPGGQVFAILKLDKRRVDTESRFNRYRFCAPTCSEIVGTATNGKICQACFDIHKRLRRQCKRIYDADTSDYKEGQSLQFTAAELVFELLILQRI